MKHSVLAISGLALSAFLTAAPAMAQDRVDANGMPTTHSTPAEHADTAELNNQTTNTNAATDQQAAATDSQYQAQQQQYQDQLQQNQQAQQDYQQKSQAYSDQTARYESLRARAMPPSAPPIIAACGRIAMRIGRWRKMRRTLSASGWKSSMAIMSAPFATSPILPTDGSKRFWLSSTATRWCGSTRLISATIVAMVS